MPHPRCRGYLVPSEAATAYPSRIQRHQATGPRRGHPQLSPKTTLSTGEFPTPELSAEQHIFERMSDSVERPSPADDAPHERGTAAESWAAHQEAMASRLARIADLERQICGLQAAQVEEVAVFVTDRVGYDEEHGFPADQAQYRGMVAEVAIAKKASVITAQGFMADAYSLVNGHPRAMEALRSGSLGLSPARAIVKETCLLGTPEQIALADQIITEEAVDVLPGKVRPLAERRVAEIDPDAVERRSRRERADKHVALVDAGSSTAWLNSYLPAEQAVACWNSLNDHAHALYAAGDIRSVSHIMCDTLVERLTGVNDATAIPAHINVVMTDASLLGLSDVPAHLVGTGPLPAGVARLLATSGSSWLKRFLTDPIDGSITAADKKRRRFAGHLRDLITIRDQHCRGIQCASPIIDFDHIVEFARRGPTRLHNGQGLSKNCHTTRDNPRMRVTRGPRRRVWSTATFRPRAWRPAASAGRRSGCVTLCFTHLSRGWKSSCSDMSSTEFVSPSAIGPEARRWSRAHTADGMDPAVAQLRLRFSLGFTVMWIGVPTKPNSSRSRRSINRV